MIAMKNITNTTLPFSDPEIPGFDEDDLMVPPWIKYPNLPSGSMGWRMGVGEQYSNNFIDWYKSNRGIIKKKVQDKYTAEGKWKLFYINLRGKTSPTKRYS